MTGDHMVQGLVSSVQAILPICLSSVHSRNYIG